MLFGTMVILSAITAYLRPSKKEFKSYSYYDSLRHRRQQDSLRRAYRYAALQDSYAQLRQERERRRQEREIRYRHLQDSFAALKDARLAARAEREARYKHLQDSFAALKASRQAEREAREHRLDSLRQLQPPKLLAGQTIDLNTADTTLLKRVPGIGSSRARAIVRYRERLGGFYSLQQLLEIPNLPSSCQAYLTVRSQDIQRLDLNNCSLQQLMRHPYLNFQQAKAIVEYRRKYGPLTTLQPLVVSGVFNQTEIERLEPYIQKKPAQ